MTPWPDSQDYFTRERAKLGALLMVEKAAPAMLEALRLCVAHLSAVALTRRMWTAADQANFERIERAIAKAEGRVPDAT